MSQRTVGRLPAAAPRLSDYPLHSGIRARFGDMDGYRHVNNVAIASYYEEARMDFSRRVLGGPGSEFHPPDTRYLVARIVIEYLAEVPYPAAFQLGAGIAHVGRSSFTIGLALFLDGDEENCLGTCETVQVHSRAGRAAPLHPALVARFGEVRVPPRPRRGA